MSGVFRGGGGWGEVASHHGGALHGAVQGRHHVGPLHPSQYGAQRSQSGAFLLGPVREEGAGGGLAALKQIQLLGLVAQRDAHLPPSLARSFLQEALHLFLLVVGEVDVQPVVWLAVPVRACRGNKGEILQAKLLVLGKQGSKILNLIRLRAVFNAQKAKPCS